MRSMRMAAVVVAGVVGLGVVAVPAQEAQAAPVAHDETTTALVNLLHFNDFHGRIDRDLTVQFAGTIEQLRAEQGEQHTVLLSGGDNIGASLYNSSSQQDRPTINVLNVMNVAASAVGNHEFDRGIDDLQTRVRPETLPPYLAANVQRDGQPIDDGFVVVPIDGIQVGIIGAVTLETPTLVSPAGITGVTFSDPVEAVNAVAARLSDGNPANGEADVIVAEYHEGAQVALAPNAPQDVQAAALQAAMSESEAFRSIVQDTAPEVDVIFNGHTHQAYSWMAPAPAGSDNAVRPVVQASSYASFIGQVMLTVDRATGDVTFVQDARLVPRTTAAPAELIATYDRAERVNAIVQDALNQAAITGNQVVGSLTADITTAFADGKRDDRANASTMGTLVANMYRDATADEARGGAEIGVTNPGGLRAELLRAATAPETEDGVIRVAEAVAVLPFANNLWTVDLTGDQFRTLLEQQWQTDAQGNVPTRAYLQLGLSDNVEYTYDSTAPAGERITGIWIDGSPIVASQAYRVAAPIFLLSGGDNFRSFLNGTNEQDSGLVDSDAFQSYITSNSPLTPDFSRRQLDLVGVPTTAVAGDTVSFTVNKVDLTSLGTPVSQTLDLYQGETLLGQFPVENGSATVSFVVPGASTPVVEPGVIGALVVQFAAHLFGADTAAVGPTTFELRTASGTAVPFSIDVQAAVTPTPTPTPSATSPAPTSTPPGSTTGPVVGQAGGGSTPNAQQGTLPRTGAEQLAGWWIVAAALLLVGGALLTRRRHS